MAKSTSPLSRLKKSLKGTPFEHVDIFPCGAQSYEIWDYQNYLCMITEIDGQWGATHNSSCPNVLWNDAHTAISWYVSLSKVGQTE